MQGIFRVPRFRIRTRLVLLVIGAVAPFLAYTGVRTRERLVERRAYATDRARGVATGIGERLDDRLAEITVLLRATAPLVRARPDDVPTNDMLLRRVMEGFPANLINFGVFDRSGRNFGVSLTPVGDRTRYSAAGRRYLRDAIRHRGLALGDVVRSNLDTTRWGSGLSTALFAPDSSVEGVLVATFRLAWLEDIVAVADLPPGAVAWVVSDSGRLIGLAPPRSADLGRDVSAHPLVRAALASDTISREMAGLDGVVRLHRVDRITRAPWRVIVGIPLDAIGPSVSGLLVRELALFSVTLAVAILVALLIGYRIANPVQVLAGDVAAVASGDLAHRSAVRSTSEIGWLAEQFNRMTATLERNRDELRAGEQRYRAIFEQSPVPMWITETHSLRFLAVNDAAIRQYGWTAAEFAGMTLRDVRPVDEHEAFDASVRAVPASDLYRGRWRHRRRDGTPLDIDEIGRAHV